MSCHQNMCQDCANQCCHVAPIVMPTKIINQRQFTFCEQPIIFPVECRKINEVILVPRCYQVYRTPINTLPQSDCCRNQQ